MGRIRDWAANAPTAMFGALQLRADSIRNIKSDTQPLTGVTATVEPGSTLESRFTMTRIAVLGPFALAAKKKRGGEMWLLVEGPGFAWTEQVDRKKVGQARAFAAKVNLAVRQAGASG